VSTSYTKLQCAIFINFTNKTHSVFSLGKSIKLSLLETIHMTGNNY